MSFGLVTRLRLDGIRWGRSTATTPSRDSPVGSGRGFGAERNPARIVSFSDAVFAITVTLLVLEIRPPADYTNLLHGLLALWPSYLAYALTFLFIGQVWANHHVMFDHIRTSSGSTRAVTGCSAKPLTLRTQRPSAGDFSWPWLGSRQEPCSAS